MIKNKELELALDFIERTDRNLFITGKAGTGKTTFLHKIKETSLKRMVVVAPTGVAAINAKGVTIHSFFQMPFGPILPDQSQNSSQRKFSRTKIDIIKSLNLVIIDEISMVRADLLDGIDHVLRRYKNRNKVFGGAQIVMIGDLQQLSPVVKPNEYNLLKNYYQTMYFFSSKAFQHANALSIELKHIYRQENEEFITILNEIRNDELTQTSQDRLNQRFNPNFEPKDDEGYITLTTHNRKANSINESKLAKLKEESHFFNATIEGNFSETAYPNSEVVELKVGAQVMFIKNDSSPEKRYFNGKIGVIVHIDEDIVTVECPNEDDPIETSYERWDNVKYSLDEETNEINEEIAGIFSQMPLRLAWAITIHKSQGLTFDKAIIDAGSSFAHGQTYVALSRCTSLEGIVLKTQIGSQSIINDGTVKSFSDDVAANEPDREVLMNSEKSYQLSLMAEIFSFQSLLYPTQRMIDIYYKNRSTLQGNILTPAETIKDKGVVQLMKVAASFQKQLQALDSETSILAESNQKIQDRFQKAIDYFKGHSAEFISKPLEEMSFSSDNKAVKKEFKKQFDTLLERMTVKQYVLKNLTKFGVQEYLKIRSDAVLQESEAPKKKVLKPKGDSVLAVRLRELRDDIATAENIPHFQVFTQEALYGMCEALPRNAAQLKKVKGMGKIRVRKYGEEIIEVIESYCKEKGLEDKSEPIVEVEKKPSHQISLELFKQGFSIKEIAKERNLTSTTIESHLAKYIPSGDIDILELIPLKRYQKLVKEIEATEFNGLKELKTALDDSYSYMEIKMALSSLEG